VSNEEVPKNWAQCELSEIVDILDSQRIPINNAERQARLAKATTTYPYYGATGQVGEIDDYIFEGESILLGEDGAPFLEPQKPKAYVVRGRYWVNNHAHILRAIGEIKNQFLCHQLNILDYKPYVSGTTRLKLTQSNLKALPIKIAPLNEQHRIVEKIETLFARIDKGEEALCEVQKLLQRYRQSILKAAVTGELTRDWREANQHKLEPASDLLTRILESRGEKWQRRGKYKKPAEPDTVDLPDLPTGWTWATLPMLGEFGRGKSKHRPRNDPRLYENGTYPFLQTGRVRNSSGRISEYDKLYNEFGLSQSRLWPAGTVCITIAANIAESAILDIDACFPDSVVGFIPHKDISAEYVETFVRTAKRDLDRYAPATAQKNINLEILNNLAVPLPPAEEQEQIRASLDAAFSTIDSLEQTCLMGRTRSASLRQSILKSAFTGQLVPQDSDDEPASELLARICAERAARPKKRSKKKATRKKSRTKV
jgi:type I restriction enzyme S subunit